MKIRENKYPILDVIYPKHVLVSVFDKTGLPELITGLRDINPDVLFYSTGGTGREIVNILGGAEAVKQNYISVEEFIGMPESEGGLVKTLDSKIHAGILHERGNPGHERFIGEIIASLCLPLVQ